MWCQPAPAPPSDLATSAATVKSPVVVMCKATENPPGAKIASPGDWSSERLSCHIQLPTNITLCSIGLIKNINTL